MEPIINKQENIDGYLVKVKPNAEYSGDAFLNYIDSNEFLFTEEPIRHSGLFDLERANLYIQTYNQLYPQDKLEFELIKVNYSSTETFKIIEES